MKIDDPDLIDNSPNVTLINLNEKLLILFKEHSVYKILTSDCIDPERTHLETSNTYEKISSYGASSPLFARIFLQSKEMFDLAFHLNPDKEHLLEIIWEANLLLISCANYRDEIAGQVNNVAMQCDALIEQHKLSGSIPPLPKVKNLEINAKAFLNTGKLFLTQCFKIISIFTKLPIKHNNETHFNIHIDWLANNRPELIGLTQSLKSDLEWIRTLAECRNAIEHSRAGLSITLNNFKLLPGNKFTEPTWSYDLTSKIQVKRESSIVTDLCIYIDNMLGMLEEIILHCISAELSIEKKFQIYKIDDSKINPQCPIAYQVFFDKTFLAPMSPQEEK